MQPTIPRRITICLKSCQIVRFYRAAMHLSQIDIRGKERLTNLGNAQVQCSGSLNGQRDPGKSLPHTLCTPWCLDWPKLTDVPRPMSTYGDFRAFVYELSVSRSAPLRRLARRIRSHRIMSVREHFRSDNFIEFIQDSYSGIPGKRTTCGLGRYFRRGDEVKFHPS